MKRILTIFFSFALSGAVNAASTTATTISNNTPGFIKQAEDCGAIDPSTIITVTVWLKLHNQAQLDALVRQQQQIGHANYHQWLTQSQFNRNFGPAPAEATTVQNFLRGKGLTVDVVAENNTYVRAHGTVGDIQNAFHVSIHNYTFSGKTYRSNTADPSIIDASGSFIGAIMGMDDVAVEPAILSIDSLIRGSTPVGAPLSDAPAGLFYESQVFRPPETHTFSGDGHTATYTGNRYGPDITNTTLGHLPVEGYSPNEVRTAYNLAPLYNAGYDGSGETIVIIDAFGSSTIEQDAGLFSQIYGLPPVHLQVVRAPGLTNSGLDIGAWASETTLDVEWAHVVAPGAEIAVVLSVSDPFGTLSGLMEAINYAVVHHIGNTISNSWGLPEYYFTPAALYQGERIFQMAASEGIDVNSCTHDYGDFGTWPLANGPRVSYPASSAYDTAIGGTTLALNPDNTIKFQTGWGNNFTRISSRSPSGGTVADDNSPIVAPIGEFLAGSGGGASRTWAKPSFQSALPGNRRLIPDISWLADPFTGVEMIQTIDGITYVFAPGGTSLACPMFSGLMAIAAQKAGHPLGQAAPLIYNLSAGAITDIVPVGSADNVTGFIDNIPILADQLSAPLINTTTYYSALFNTPMPGGSWTVLTFGTDTSLTVAPGWDNVTGVGTPNGLNFINAIAP
jgi:subtilase family serine protease